MNRFAKNALEDISKLTLNEQMRFYNYCLENESTKAIIYKSPKAKFRDVFIHYLAHFCEYPTANGTKKQYEYLAEDRLQTVSVQLFCGQFYYDSKLGGFCPGITTKTVSRAIAEHLLIKSDLYIEHCWNGVKNHLLCPSSSGRELVEPVLIKGHDTSQHLYFINDQENMQIKIGISYFPGIRIKQVERSYCRGSLSIMHIVKGGGRLLESELHQRFSSHKVEGEREWFNYHDDIFSCISEFKQSA